MFGHSTANSAVYLLGKTVKKICYIIISMDYLLLIRYSISGLMPLICVSALGSLLVYYKIFTKVTLDLISAAYSNFVNPVFVIKKYTT